MKIIGLTKVRNEALIMKETLDHWERVCTGGIYVYDDVSMDETASICDNHPAVKAVLRSDYWDPDRERAEWRNRQAVLERAQQDAGVDDWFVYFDADERLSFAGNFGLFFEKSIDAIACKLFDIYITPEDVDKPYIEREWVGPEFRTITMFFRNSRALSYSQPDQRIVTLAPNARTVVAGYIKHFGKGLSVEHWEETCDYYIKHWPKYSAKWQLRKGKAVHDFVSDFNNPLIKWSDRDEKGFPLKSQTYGKN